MDFSTCWRLCNIVNRFLQSANLFDTLHQGQVIGNIIISRHRDFLIIMVLALHADFETNTVSIHNKVMNFIYMI